MSQPYLFYSDRCANSNQVIETLKALNKAGLYKFVKVETIPRDQIPSFLKKVPTLYVPETKDVVVGKDIFGFIAKPTNARTDKPVTREQNTPGAQSGGASSASPGEYSPWGFEGSGMIGESYSLWDAPTRFASEGGSMYTYLDGSSQMSSAAPQPVTENTLKTNKVSSNDDVSKRMEEMTKQREKEFGGITRK
jgi:hypothetical protein